MTHFERLSSNLVLAVCTLDDGQAPLLGGEAALLHGSTRSRIKEFTAGRCMARAAMNLLGIRPQEILQGPGGEPLFPADVCGSISHSASVAAALVGSQSTLIAVGVDVNDGRPIGALAALDVTWARETRLLMHLGICADEAAAHNFAFSAKEAIYKCQYHVTNYDSLHFHQVRLVAPTSGSADMLSVAGWRVPQKIAATLARVQVNLKVICGVEIAVATYSTIE
ncbi:MAG: hypothetical protein PSV26_07250 [Polaromonas sp.]|uniref:4'-phosphopantetheinyl transferase family protein n=1 Tax=Polaromonas sp. TaxID=1869339 RepID=UPI002488EDA9|nr:hypothetical protein [Polaromonas sp.]MDI1237261.1 hypothetical protein [Polaromonas sp.]